MISSSKTEKAQKWKRSPNSDDDLREKNNLQSVSQSAAASPKSETDIRHSLKHYMTNSHLKK